MTALPQIPGYRVVRLISEGKRSRMYLAEQESLSRQVALKVLSDEFYKDPQFKKRFIDGGKSGAQLNHPNILAVFDIGSVSGFPYIATEYLPGGTLRDRLEQQIAEAAPGSRVFGAAAGRVANTSCVLMPGVTAETQLMGFDLAGIAVSAGSACSSGKVTPSHVLLAMGASEAEAEETVRVSLGWTTTGDEVDRLAAVWQQIHQRATTRAASSA